MRRAVHLVSFITVVASAATILTAGSAVAAVQPAPTAVETAATAAHGLGAKPPAQRLAPHAGIGALAVAPVSVDLRQWAVTPGDQGQVGSCVTWAIDYGMLGWYSRYSGRAGQPFAPMYTYSQINGGVDEGSSPISAMTIAVSQGSDTRADYTQGDYDWKTQPTVAERANAAHYKILGYHTLFMGSNFAGATTALKNALAAKHPVAITMAVRHGFDILGSDPAAVDDDTTSQIRGYHEVLALGYDASGLIIENSWGTHWANGGYGRLSWALVQHDVLEAETIDGFAPPPPTPPVVTAPTVAVVAAPASTASTVAYKVTWKGTAGTSGAITHYNAWYQVDGGGLVPVVLASPTSASFTLAAHIGHSYRVAVRVTGGALSSVVHYSAAFTPAHAH